ncbi:hypothetical protein TPENAI_70116 [Tenacibaculum litopenaei]|uniref:hypothetical protein n=1 Tax=Tenacibaculum litopenaei TaxID=396016 RepID=UPI0038948A7E
MKNSEKYLTQKIRLCVLVVSYFICTNTLVAQETTKDLTKVSSILFKKLKESPKGIDYVLYNKDKSYKLISYVEKCSIITLPLDKIEASSNLIAKGKDLYFIAKTVKFINKNDGFALIKRHKGLYYSFFLSNTEPVAPTPKN